MNIRKVLHALTWLLWRLVTAEARPEFLKAPTLAETMQLLKDASSFSLLSSDQALFSSISNRTVVLGSVERRDERIAAHTN